MKVLSKKTNGGYLESIMIQVDTPKDIELYKELIKDYKCPHCGEALVPENDVCKLILDDPLRPMNIGFSMELGRLCVTCAECHREAIPEATMADATAFEGVADFMAQLRSAASKK